MGKCSSSQNAERSARGPRSRMHRRAKRPLVAYANTNPTSRTDREKAGRDAPAVLSVHAEGPTLLCCQQVVGSDGSASSTSLRFWLGGLDLWILVCAFSSGAGGCSLDGDLRLNTHLSQLGATPGAGGAAALVAAAWSAGPVGVGVGLVGV